MSDWHGLFNSDDFRAYRRKQARAIAELIKGKVQRAVWKDPATLQELSGLFEAVKVLLTLPERQTEDPNMQQTLREQLEEDIAGITKYLMREALRG